MLNSDRIDECFPTYGYITDSRSTEFATPVWRGGLASGSAKYREDMSSCGGALATLFLFTELINGQRILMRQSDIEPTPIKFNFHDSFMNHFLNS